MEAILEFKVFPNDVMADKMKTLSAASALDEKQIENVLLQDIQEEKAFLFRQKQFNSIFQKTILRRTLKKLLYSCWKNGIEG